MIKVRYLWLISICLILTLAAFTSCDNTVEEPSKTSGDASSAEVEETYYPTKTFSGERQYCADIPSGNKLYKIYKYTEDGYRIIGLCSYDISKDTADGNIDIGVQTKISYQSEPYYSFANAVGLSPSLETIDAVRSYIGDSSNTTKQMSVVPGTMSTYISKDAPNGVYNIGLLYSYQRYYVEVYNGSELTYTGDIAIPIGDPYMAMLYRQTTQSHFALY